MLEELEDKTEAIAQRLQKVREILGLSKKDFAEGAGMTQQTYNPFEKAQRPISLEAAKKIRKRYSISLEFIYFGKIDDLPTRISRQL